nr:reverse transcriptase domain-containing protein [Tanacetum cinerariifolium]
YALTINPTVYVSHIRQFWSTARIETTNKGTKILAIVDGKLRTIFESLIRRNLKLKDEEGISTLPNAELFENLTLMGYNILPNHKFSFQKGEGLGTPTEPHHTPSPKAQPSPQHDLSSSIHPPVTPATIPTCMQTRSSSRLVSNQSSNPTSSTNLNLKGRNQPTEGYEDAIVVPAITADNFELKHGLLTLVQNKQFFGHDKEDPHDHVRYFNKITSTLKLPNVPNTSIKLMLFPFSLEGAARIWLEKEPPRSIFTWDDLVSKIINHEAWDRFKDLLRACPHHGFSELYQLDTFYNALNSKDQDSLNFAVGGNFLDKMPSECQAIIERKSKVHYSRNKPVVSKVSTNSSTSGVSPDVAELKDMMKALLLDKKSQNQSPAPVKAVEESYVTCGGAHSYRNCLATDGNVYRDNIQEFVFQASASESPIFNSEPITSPIFEPAIALVSALKHNPKASIPYPSRRNDEWNREKANNQIDKFYQIFKDMRLSLLDLTPTCMNLELVDRSISHPVRVAEDVYVKVGSFHFSTDFVVIDFDADLRVSLILERSFLKTERALIDVFEGELTLRVGNEAITFNLDQTLRYSANYSDMTAKRIDVIDMTCEEYSQEVLGFSDTISSGNPTSYYDPIVSTTSPTLTSFGNSDFLLKEVNSFLAIENEAASSEFYQPYLDPEGDILL